MSNEKYDTAVVELALAALDGAQMMIESLRKDREYVSTALAAARLEIASLQAQLEAVGAGGVGPLVGAPAQPVAQWVPVSERLPEPGEAVLLDIGMQTPIRALWAAKHTVETNDDDGEWGEYNEDDDAYYCPEGWYEWNEYEECHFAVDKGAPVAWMKLPLPGKVAAPQPAAQAQEGTKDAARWRWIANYLVGNDTSKDDAIVACTTVLQLGMLVDTEITTQKGEAA